MNVYLDYAATTPLDKDIFKAMLPYLKEEFGNADSLHSYGRRAAYAAGEARDRVADTLGVSPREVYFTSGGTEADQWAVQRLAEGRRIAASAIEHRAVLSAAKRRNAALIPPDENGVVRPEAVERALDGETGLVAVMAVNNETGVIQPLKEISALCKARGVLLFSDCVQAAGALDLKKICALSDAVALSGHKIYGPKGTGALIVKEGVKILPLIAGGEQERGLRGGTLNTAGIVGFSLALKAAQERREAFCLHTGALRARLEGALTARYGDRITIDGTGRVPNISHITFPAGSETLLNRLDLKGVACSGGAACSAHAALPSHVLLAMGRDAEEAKRGIRFSFGRDTTKAETEFVLKRLFELIG